MHADLNIPWLPKSLRKPKNLFLVLVTLLGFFTYFFRYWDPPHVFWDENYHIASAQKYLHGVYFMEQHPPLGKLLVALGETIISPNARTDQFLGTDYGTQFEGISFAGYRFFSALFAWLAAPLLYLIFLRISKNPLVAFLLSFLYVFDNALIVHSRGAMLEGPLMFFSCGFLLLFFHLLDEKAMSNRKFMVLSAAIGAVFGLILTTKVLGLIFILFFLALLWKMFPNLNRIGQFVVLSLGGFLVVYAGVWQTHFALGSTINPALPDQGYYQASQGYRDILAQGKNGSLLSFPIMLKDSLRFVGHYNAGAPRLDLCKKDENGSPFYLWPLGARSINYRWETPNGQEYRYLYLVANPVIWWGATASVVLAAALLLLSYVVPLQNPIKNRFLLTIFLGTYLSYMIAISRITRVLYLYHYFIPLLLSFILFALMAEELRAFGRRMIGDRQRILALFGYGALAFSAFVFWSPLSYYQPLTDAQMARRSIFPIWEVHCVKCQKESGIVIPNK
jgi:dolichyl-phosphate-mannose-protein mannosyltransferase